MNIVNKITTYQNRNAGKNAQIIAHYYGLRGGTKAMLLLAIWGCVCTVA